MATTTTATTPPTRPHESPKLILIPICILACARRARRVRQRHAVRRGVGELHGVRRAPPGGRATSRGGRRTRSPRRPRTGRPTRVRRSRRGRRGGRGARRRRLRLTTIPEESAICFFPAVNHAEFKWSKAALSLIVVAAGLVSSWVVCVALYTKRSARLVGLTERFRPARWGYLFLANKYYLDDLYEKVIVRAIAHPIARAANWVNQHVIDGVVNARRQDGQGRRRPALPQHRPGGRRRRRQRLRHGRQRDRHRAATRAVRQGQPVRRSALRRRHRRRHRARDRQRVRLLERMDVLTDQNWLLSVGTFLPLAGVLVMLFIPRAEELLHKQVALVTAVATFGVGISTLLPVRLRPGRQAAVLRRRQVDRGDPLELHDRPRRHQPAAVRAVELHHAGGDHLHVRRHAGRREPEGVPHPDARPAGRAWPARSSPRT